VRVTRNDSIVTIDAILDDKGLPNIAQWHEAEALISGFEADPGVLQFHVIAHTPKESRIRFVSPEVPQMGWRTIWVRALEEAAPAPAQNINPLLRPLLPLMLKFSQTKFGDQMIALLSAGDESKPPYVIENENFIVEASKSTGTLTITDKKTNVVYSDLNRFVDGGDAGDTYNVSPPASDSLHTPRPVSLRVFRHGLVQAIEIKYMLKVPAELSRDRKSRSRNMVEIPINTRVSVFPGGDRVDIHTEVENTAQDHRLRVHFPAPISALTADYEGHYEVVRRAVGVPEKGQNWAESPRPEAPQRSFTDVTNGEIGLMIANRGLPEAEVISPANDGNAEIAITLLRCVGWLSRDDMPVRQGHAGPGFPTPSAQMAGKWAFEYSIIPHKGDWKEACKHAFAFETPLRAVGASLHAGELPLQGSFIAHAPDAFLISAVKEAEDGEGYIVRGYNPTSAEIQVNLKPLGAFRIATRVNMAEDAMAALDSDKDGNITFSASGHEVVSVRFA
jgi:mannosylglycerate hydrolase